MLHGNVLLSGWTMSDVSFWSTELVQYVLIEAVHGLGPGVVHIGGAMTYTLLILLVAYLAKGRATGREGLIRVMAAAVIMLAPALGTATSLLLLTPDHLGSAVPVLLAWLAVDRLGARWYVPLTVAVVLAWGQVADSLVLITGVAPMVVVCAVRAGARLWRRTEGLPWYELSLAAAALVSVGIARGAEALIRIRGGYVLRPLATNMAGWSAFPHHLKIAAEGLLTIFGAAFFDAHTGTEVTFAALHLIGAVAAGLAVLVALSRLGRPGHLAIGGLAVAIVVNVVAYVPGTFVTDLFSTREITAVLPFAAVVTGRVLAGPSLRARLVPVLAVLVIACAAMLGYNATRPAVSPDNANLAAWLVSHHLRAGLTGDYWVANSTTMDAGTRVTVRQVSAFDDRLVRPIAWGFKADWYDPATQHANFLVTSDADAANWRKVRRIALRTFGPPAVTFHAGDYMVLVWHKNLLAGIR